jgi:two-component system sensor histidine kinase RegB
MHGAGSGPLFLAHLYGMYVALVLTALLVGYFVSRLAGAVREREAELVAARAHAANADRLAALTPLCAGAAHELGTPLGTIALAASELARAADRATEGERLAADARLIRAEVDRCRAILDRMAARFGEATGERPSRLPSARLVEAVRALLPKRGQDRVRFVTEAGEVELPLGAMAQALANLVDNALAAAPEGEVLVRIERAGGELRLSVSDEGPGMPEGLLHRATEPFFTTKEAGRGMGLGLYLCQVTVERLGGRLSLTSAPGEGTSAALILPNPITTEPS